MILGNGREKRGRLAENRVTFAVELVFSLALKKEGILNNDVSRTDCMKKCRPITRKKMFGPHIPRKGESLPSMAICSPAVIMM
jgi:hypothetical protein